MIKLRLRSIDTKQTQKLQVPTSCSLQQLKQALAQNISSPPSSSIHISLNQKDEIVASEQDSLQSLGIISGDLLFFSVTPNSSFFQEDETLLLETQNSVQLDQDKGSNLNTQIEISGLLDTQMEKTGSLDTQMEKTGSLDTQMGESGDMDTQLGESSEGMEVDDDDGGVIDVGKSFSVPMFLRKVFVKELGDDGGNHHKLLVIAVHAVLLESGFVGFDPVGNLVVKGFRFPDEWPSQVFKLSLWYTLPEIVGNGLGDVNGVNSVVLKFQSVGKFFNVYGSLSSGSGGTHWMRVNEDELVPFLNVIWANCGSDSEYVGVAGDLSASPERKVFEFWRTVKDKIALPLLIDLCEKAGLELPLCFMQLPTDLKLQILMRLPGLDVAKVGCVCSELRYLTSSDDLWKQKFVEQFGDAETSEGQGLWKKKYAKAVERRKRRKIPGIRPFRQQFIRDPHPFAGRYPGLLPGIIGGDYDLLPAGGFNPLRQPGRAIPRLLNFSPHRNVGGLG